MSTGFLEKAQARLHVYKLPTQMNTGYCFGGGNQIAFLNVDFFDVPWDLPREDIISFVRGKRYYDKTRRFLVLSGSDFPTLTFTIEPIPANPEEPRHD